MSDNSMYRAKALLDSEERVSTSDPWGWRQFGRERRQEMLT